MKRTTLSIPDDLYSDLEVQAEAEHRTVQNLCVFAAAKLIENLKKEGNFAGEESQELADSMDSEILKKRIRGKKLTPKERAYLSRQGFTTAEINNFDDKKNGNGETKDAKARI